MNYKKEQGIKNKKWKMENRKQKIELEFRKQERSKIKNQHKMDESHLTKLYKRVFSNIVSLSSIKKTTHKVNPNKRTPNHNSKNISPFLNL